MLLSHQSSWKKNWRNLKPLLFLCAGIFISVLYNAAVLGSSTFNNHHTNWRQHEVNMFNAKTREEKSLTKITANEATTTSSQLGTCQSGILNITRKHSHALLCHPWETNVTYDYNGNYKLYVVYFLNTKIHNEYRQWMKEHLKYVPSNAYLKVVAVSYDCKIESMMYDTYYNIVEYRDGPSLLECHDEAEKETFEYHGIRAMWEIGQMQTGRNDIVFYFHSKGLTHFRSWEKYSATDTFHSKLSEKTLGQVDLVYEVFDLFPTVNKVGNKISQLGWVWYNFMFARGSYLKLVEEPIMTARRHYYEDWLGRVGLPPRRGHPANMTERAGFKPLQDGYNHHADDIYNRHQIPSMGTFLHSDGTWRRWDDEDWIVPDPLWT